MQVILTIGHSIRTAEEFLGLLRAHGVTGVADVRRIPRSRRHPQFSADAMSAFLHDCGIEYTHLPGLGGMRQPTLNSPNGGWRDEAFRGYADYMQTPEFADALEALLAFMTGRHAAIMCAEAKWQQCHRQLIADVLVARGFEVGHIMSCEAASLHQLTPFARVTGAWVHYPALF